MVDVISCWPSVGDLPTCRRARRFACEKDMVGRVGNAINGREQLQYFLHCGAPTPVVKIMSWFITTASIDLSATNQLAIGANCSTTIGYRTLARASVNAGAPVIAMFALWLWIHS